jgi:hypothetical protein
MAVTVRIENGWPFSVRPVLYSAIPGLSFVIPVLGFVIPALSRDPCLTTSICKGQ